MNNQTVIKAENISKLYRLGEVGTGTISHDINRAWKKLLGKDDPYLKIGQTNDRNTNSTNDYVWPLRNINFEINQGDTVGIIGRNGAGKSTLLKLISKITKPTTGSFKLRGRIASLLEVGTGFHPEMTGRENIFLNGAILGMSKNEIKRKFDEIVDFAGVERYIDTPVKRYSSGMYIRLAFAVAANLESEILIIDEVLAVGDAEFQKKCLGRMGDLSSKEGRTVLFVSHNMAAVKSLCNNGIVLKNGLIDYTGNVDECINAYLSQNTELSSIPIRDVSNIKRSKGNQNAIKKVWIENSNNQPTLVFLMGEMMNFCFNFDLIHTSDNINVGFGIEDVHGSRIFSMNNEILDGVFFKNVKSGVAMFKIPQNILQPGGYFLSVSIVSGGVEWIDFVPQALNFFVEAADIYGSGKLADHSQGIVSIHGEIKIKSSNDITIKII